MTTKTFPHLGIQVCGTEVRTLSLGRGKYLGPLKGATVQVISGAPSPGSALMAAPVAGPLALFAGMRQSVAFITFADGSTREHKLAGKRATGQAQIEAARFSLLAR